MAAAALLVAGGASASTVTLNTTLDLNQPGVVTGNFVTAGAYVSNLFALPLLSTPFSVAEGDTFVWNFDFAGNQALTVNNLLLFEPLVVAHSGAPSSNISMTGQLDLLDADGHVVSTASKTDLDGDNFVGQVFLGFEFNHPSVTFSGFRYSGVLNDYDNQGVTTRSYDGPSLYLFGSGLSVGESTPTNPGSQQPTGPIPEPAAWTLMIGGFGLAGASLRRRKAALSA